VIRVGPRLGHRLQRLTSIGDVAVADVLGHGVGQRLLVAAEVAEPHRVIEAVRAVALHRAADGRGGGMTLQRGGEVAAPRRAGVRVILGEDHGVEPRRPEADGAQRVVMLAAEALPGAGGVESIRVDEPHRRIPRREREHAGDGVFVRHQDLGRRSRLLRVQRRETALQVRGLPRDQPDHDRDRLGLAHSTSSRARPGPAR
jgi:hypothetical protein